MDTKILALLAALLSCASIVQVQQPAKVQPIGILSPPAAELVRLKVDVILAELAMKTFYGVVQSIYPIENVGVIARSVIFPPILRQGQGIIEAQYPNASILCLDVANYSGSVNGLIWSMDRELVEEHGLYYLIDQASRLFNTCAGMLMRAEPKPDAASRASAEMEEQIPAVSMADAKKALVAQIEDIQEMVRFAQTVKPKQNE